MACVSVRVRRAANSCVLELAALVRQSETLQGEFIGDRDCVGTQSSCVRFRDDCERMGKQSWGSVPMDVTVATPATRVSPTGVDVVAGNSRAVGQLFVLASPRVVASSSAKLVLRKSAPRDSNRGFRAETAAQSVSASTAHAPYCRWLSVCTSPPWSNLSAAHPSAGIAAYTGGARPRAEVRSAIMAEFWFCVLGQSRKIKATCRNGTCHCERRRGREKGTQRAHRWVVSGWVRALCERDVGGF